jgi:hypothetical protein
MRRNSTHALLWIAAIYLLIVIVGFISIAIRGFALPFNHRFH